MREGNEMSEIEVLKDILTTDIYTLSVVGDKYQGFVVVDRKFAGQGRWSTRYDITTRSATGEHYRWTLSEGSTEYQDDDEFDGRIEVVEPYWETVIRYRKKAA